MPDNTDLQGRIEQLEQQLADLQQEVGASPRREQRTGRRTMLKLAAASGVAGVAALVSGSQRAAAANGDPILCGSSFNVASLPTGMAVTGTTAGYGFGITDNGLTSLPSIRRGAVLGHARDQAFNSGVYGFAEGTASAVDGVATGSGTALGAYSVGGNGVVAYGGQLGGVFSGEAGALLLQSFPVPAPPTRTSPQQARVLDSDQSNDLWWSYAPGTPAKWRKIAGPQTAGALHPIDPIRVYDSRASEPSPGTIAAGQNRVISVADGRSLDTGAVTVANVVPAGATTVAVNLTITETTGAGFLTLAPGDAMALGASSINWGSSGISLANALIVKLDANRQLKTFCGGAGTTHFVVDVQGYWL